MSEGAGPKGSPQVATVELFFDLVFVFTITQVTHLVEHAHDVLGFLKPALVFTVIWWHYAGYVWLTNATGARGRIRLVLLGAMAGFLVMAIALPTVFTGGGLAFGLGYLLVVALHLGAFAAGGGPGAWKAVLPLAAINGGVALLVLAAGIVDASWDWAFFAAGCALFLVSTLVQVEGGFSVRAGHFAERHGLVMLIVLGESIIAIGTGAADRGFDAWTLGAIVLALGLLAILWWSYFDRDDARAEHALAHAPAAKQARLALVGYWYPHLVLIAGVILVAAGLKEIVAHPTDVSLHASAVLAAGVALYLLGGAYFRAKMHAGPVAPRFVGAVGAGGIAALGLVAPGIVALGAAVALGLALLAWEARAA